jgi:Proto-chlorophyllide reductase 57 kD subunit
MRAVPSSSCADDATLRGRLRIGFAMHSLWSCNARCCYKRGMVAMDELPWAPEADACLEQVPEVMRRLTRQRLEMHARDLGRPAVTLDVVEDMLRIVAEGSAQAGSDMTWTEEAQRRVERIPETVRGMVVKMIEADAHRRGIAEISSDLVGEAAQRWSETGRFHE